MKFLENILGLTYIIIYLTGLGFWVSKILEILDYYYNKYHVYTFQEIYEEHRLVYYFSIGPFTILGLWNIKNLEQLFQMPREMSKKDIIKVALILALSILFIGPGLYVLINFIW